MRKIEKEMLDAVKSRKNWKKANTEVTFNSDNSSRVLLHGNQIAVLADNIILFSLAGWNTVTTRSRLNALLGDFGFRVIQRGSPRVIDLKTRKEYPINPEKVYDIDRGVVGEAVNHD